MTDTTELSPLIIDLSALGLLQVSGPDAKKLLQGQLTCDLEEVTATKTSLGAYCQPQGRMVSLFRLFLFEGSYYLQMPAEILAETLTVLKKYAVFFKAQLQDASGELDRISYSGSDAAASLNGIGIEIPELVDHATTYQNILIIRLAGNTPHYELIGPKDALQSLRLKLDGSQGDFNQWERLNISAGIPSLTTATSGKLLPHDINLPQINGVSWTKGCYTGQEIIARMHYRGQLKKQMFHGLVEADSLPQPGSDIYSENGASGTIVNSCSVGDGHYEILFIANTADIEMRQVFLNPAKIAPIEMLTLSY
jgi:folate-binding protein YgfZ